LRLAKLSLSARRGFPERDFQLLPFLPFPL
jgi:succinate dehydrogenase flavin-adding protein (antitoxin of CptAB toxin-antitoxin module)